MAILVYHGEKRQEWNLPEQASIGNTPGCDLTLPGDLQGTTGHMLITRSHARGTAVLLDPSFGASLLRVNGTPVVWLKTLRHGDRIELGRALLTYWEIIVRSVCQGRRFFVPCPVCKSPFDKGQQVIACPRCSLRHHQACWCFLEFCSRDGCNYPAQEVLHRILSASLRIEKLSGESEPIKQHRHCQAGQPIDVSPFKSGDQALYCPDCETPFHFQCWLQLERCPRCAHDIEGLIRQISTPGELNPLSEERRP